MIWLRTLSAVGQLYSSDKFIEISLELFPSGICRHILEFKIHWIEHNSETWLKILNQQNFIGKSIQD